MGFIFYDHVGVAATIKAIRAFVKNVSATDRDDLSIEVNHLTHTDSATAQNSYTTAGSERDVERARQQAAPGTLDESHLHQILHQMSSLAQHMHANGASTSAGGFGIVRTLGFRQVAESTSMRERTRTRHGMAQPFTAWHPPLGDHTLCNCTILHRRGSSHGVHTRDTVERGSMPQTCIACHAPH